MGNTFAKPEDVPIKWYNGYVAAMPSQQGRNVAITGCTSGTGLEAAKAIVTRGGHALALNRPSERAKAAVATIQEAVKDGGKVTHVDCDLQDFASVRTAAAQIQKLVGTDGLHCLLNNAGVMVLPEQPTKDDYDVQMQTNHLSHFLLTSLLMPALETAAEKTGDARVAQYSSAGRNGLNASNRRPLDATFFAKLSENKYSECLKGDSFEARFARYQQTKLANTVFAVALKDKLAAKGSKVKSLMAHPGGSRTSLQANAASSGGAHGQEGALKYMVNFISQSSADGCLPLLACGVERDAESGDFYVPGQEGPISKMMGDTVVGPPKKMDWAKRTKKEELTLSKEAHKILWERSEKAVGQPFF